MGKKGKNMTKDKHIEEFQKLLPSIRRAAGWTSEEFGKKIGVSRQAISNVENGKFNLTKTHYIAMRYVLDEEMDKHPDDTEMLRLMLDALVDNPEKYSDEEKRQIKQKAEILVTAISKKANNRKEISKEMIAIIGAITAIATGTIIASIVLGSWKKY